MRLGRPKQALTDKDIETGGKDTETGVRFAEDNETGVPVGQLAVPKIVRLVLADTRDRVTETEVHECGDGKAWELLAELILSTVVKEQTGQKVHGLSQALRGESELTRVPQGIIGASPSPGISRLNSAFLSGKSIAD